VLICHALPPLPLTTEYHPCDWTDLHLISSCEEQVNELACHDIYPLIWCIISQFSEPKTFTSVEMGITYNDEVFLGSDGGICCPDLYLTIEYPFAGAWPSDGSAISAAVTETPWSGTFVPVAWITGYAYCSSGQSTQFELVPSPLTDFIGWASTTGQYAPACISAMGIEEPGSPCCAAPPTPADETSWGEIKTLYR
jgi:hypothetical protein